MSSSRSKFLGFLLLAFMSLAAASSTHEEMRKLTTLVKPSKDYHFDPSSNSDDTFRIFCRIAEDKSLLYYFRTATLRVISASDDIKLYKGYSPYDVYQQYQQSRRWLLWFSNVLPWRVRDTNFPTFNTSCFGIYTAKPYSVTLLVKHVDPQKFLIMIAGLTLFFMAGKLSRSTMFFYVSGTGLGALGAALVFLFVVTRILPKGKSGYFTITALWTLAVYFAGETWNKIEDLVQDKLSYIVIYLLAGASVAFLCCYRWGPPSNPRTVDIIRWGLQGAGLALIHFSSDFVELSTAIMFLLLAFHSTRQILYYYVRLYLSRFFPPKARLLTEDEYITQGAIETEKALTELRKFCSSPESKPWKLVSKLKNPRRFSSFVEGESHLLDKELMDYDTEEIDEAPVSQMSQTLPNNYRIQTRNATYSEEVLTDDDSEGQHSLNLRHDDQAMETEDED